MATPEFRPTHVVPQDGLPAWEAPDAARPTEPLDPLLPVQLITRRGDWGRILCANGWSAWVDGRLLVSVPQNPPESQQPLAHAADPRPLMGRAEESLRRYRRAAEELADGRIDGETFGVRTRGLRVGMVVDGEAVWLYDAEHERWVYSDGTHLQTYAASAEPGRPDRAPAEDGPGATDGAAAAEDGPGATDEVAAPEPTQVVDIAHAAGHRPTEPAGTEPTQLPPPVGGSGAAPSHPPTSRGER
ncbi:hypothetical protein LRD69_00380 [Streptomyces sp. JH14]|uniref:hypothetical protein n=1 Tax=Streptomyces sp. JH14 TaxID=2793630 RepID=UPI0023F88C26|nr:hypothetical protein [Streptomyces sp. JH14]MDF6040649.1 hypothetical protein [Streptomyces sp. JH14]